MAESIPIPFLTAIELSERLGSGTLTSEDLVGLCFQQMALDEDPKLRLNAIISPCPREMAIAQARRLDEERKSGRVRSRLHGLPVLVKDAIVTSDELGMPTTVGAAVFKHKKAKRSATVIDRLIDAGAIIIAKTNLTEFCGLKSNDTPMGYSAVGGQTRSLFQNGSLPEEKQPFAGGSSAGSAVGLSGGFAPLALGTETSGSVVYPCGANGVYGMKLTIGNHPTDGLFKLSETFDALGVMARGAEDLELLMEVVVVKSDWGTHDDESKEKWNAALKEKWNAEHMVSAWENRVQGMKDSGARVVYPLEMPDAFMLKCAGETLHCVAYYEIRPLVEEFISTNYHPSPELRTLKDVAEWNENHASEAMPQPHTTQTEILACVNNTMTPEGHHKAVHFLRGRSLSKLKSVMDENEVDFILASSESVLFQWAACAGWPIGCVPVSNWEGNWQPWGMVVLARKGRDAEIVEFMKAWNGQEGLNGVREPPEAWWSREKGVVF